MPPPEVAPGDGCVTSAVETGVGNGRGSLDAGSGVDDGGMGDSVAVGCGGSDVAGDVAAAPVAPAVGTGGTV